MRTTLRCLVATTVSGASFAQFLAILRKLELTGEPASPGFRQHAPIPASSEELLSVPQLNSFLPLFTPYFDFHNQQLTTLGDLVIDDYLSDVTLSYCAHMGLTLSTNAARQLGAVFHNHFTMQLFASELGFAELAMPLSSLESTHAADTAAASLDFLSAHRPGVTHRDTAGTSFHVTPLSSGQSPLGWKMSHFIGAVQQAFGPIAAKTCVGRLYDIDNAGNLPGCAVKLLLRVLEHYPAPNVAEALLAAQGLPTCFVGKTRAVPNQASTDSAAFPDMEERNEGYAGKPSSSTPSTTHSLLVLTGFGERHGSSGSANGAAVSPFNGPAGEVSPRVMRELLASGPGLVDYSARWKERTAALVAQNAEPNPAVSIDDGWLSPAEQRRFQRGPAFANSVDFSVEGSFADVYGLPAPIDGKVIPRRKFKKKVLDPLFYDKMSDHRNGVPFNTQGEPLHEYLDTVNRPHQRLFEVTMMTPNSQGRVIGQAIASRYTVAREMACKAYIGGVLSDLQRLSSNLEDSAFTDTNSSPL